jgi:Pyridine nucleotide-disulphide oxidoreductase
VVWLGILIGPNIPAILVALLAVWGYQRAVLDRLLERIPRSTSPPEAAPRLPCCEASISRRPARRPAARYTRHGAPHRRAPPRRGREEIGYTSPVIATGATPRELLGMPRLADVNTLRGLDDALALREALRPGAWVVIIGAGFIGSRPGRAGHGRVRTPERSHGDCGRSARWCAPSAGRWEPR